MRKITQQAINAFMNNNNFHSGNTVVLSGKGQNPTQLLLHLNCIAERWDDGTMRVCDGGWQTNTTKERLNGLPNVRVHQRNFQWYLNNEPWDGSWKVVN